MKEIAVKTNLLISAPVSICPECFEKKREIYGQALIIYCEHNKTGGSVKIDQSFNNEGVLINKAGDWLIRGPMSREDFVAIIKSANPDYREYYPPED